MIYDSVRTVSHRPSLASIGTALLVEQRRRAPTDDYPPEAFATEAALMELPPETPADALALALVGLNIVDRNLSHEDNDVIEAETVAAMCAIRRSLRVLAGTAGLDFAQVLGGFYVNEFRAAVLEPDERETRDGAVT